MAKLNQILAVENGAKSRSQRGLTEIDRVLGKDDLVRGLSRTYERHFEDGDVLPSEETLVQVTVPAALQSVEKVMTELFDVTLTKETANQEARADVSVNGGVLLVDVPVTYLLFLEKRLVDLATLVGRAPVLDPAKVWQLDTNAGTGVWRADAIRTARTKKEPRTHVKYEATEHHPAQTEMYYEDKVVGTWNTIHYSGALPAGRRQEILARIETLLNAVRAAREEANAIEAPRKEAAATVFRYLFGA